MTGPEVTAAMKAEDVDAGLVERACRARWDATGSEFRGYNGDVARTWDALAALFPVEAEVHREHERHALAAVLPEIQAQARKELADDLTWLADAREEYAHGDVIKETDAVRVALGVAQGEPAWGWLPSWRWDDWKKRAARLTATTVEARDAQRSRAAAQDDDGDPNWATPDETKGDGRG